MKGVYLDSAHFNGLFPFHLMVDNRMKIVSAGPSIQKIYPSVSRGSFFDYFRIQRPNVPKLSFEDLVILEGQLVILESTQSSLPIILRGSLNYLETGNVFLFAGSPWFGSMDEVISHSLTLSDFALQDPMLDLLHVLKNQEIVTQEVKQLLVKVSQQKNEIRQSETKYRAIVETAADIIYKINGNGRFKFINEIAEHITGYPVGELLQMEFYNLVSKIHKGKVIDFYTEQIAHKTPSTYLEFPISTKEGKEIWLGQSAQLSTGSNDEVELTVVSIDITNRRKAEQKLLREEEKYRNIIANMNLGLLEVDTNDRIQFANQSFANMAGYTVEEMIGKKAVDLVMGKEEKKLMLQKMKLREEGVSDLYPVPVVKKSGEKRWWLISGAPRYNDKGDLVGSVGIHLDITDQKRLEVELQLAKQKAEDSSKSKENFLATMSHEIRTPLNAIIGITELMTLDKHFNNEENIDTLRYSAKNLLALITDVLDISKINAGKIEIVKNPIVLNELLARVCGMFRQELAEKKLEIILDAEQSLPKVTVGDELRLTQILNNLISNAIKFTDKGYIKIAVSAEVKDEVDARIHFKITDTGMGIKKNKLGKIFEAFEQADQGIVRKFGGTGLGLNITKKLVEMLGGKISVESRYNLGSTFSFFVDMKVLKQDEATSAGDALNNPNTPGIKGKKVLLVEDNVINQKVVGSYFNLWGLHHDIANNGKEALEMLNYKDYDVVILDLFMPVMDGFKTLKILRKDKDKNALPVIALTASAEINLMEKAVKMGANCCMTKPFNSQELLDTLSKILNIKANKNDRKTYIKKKNTNGHGLINLQNLEQASMGSKEFVREMVDLFCVQIPELINQAEGYFQERKMREFGETIHKLKYNILMIGVDSLRKDLVFIEENSTKKSSKDQLESAFERIKLKSVKAVSELKEIK